MLHETLFAGGGLPLLLDTQGEAIAVVPAGAEPVEATALVGPESLKQVRTEQGTRQVRERTFTLGTDAASRLGGVAQVQRNARIEYAGETWAVVEIEAAGAGTVRTVGRISALEERTRAGYRARN